MKIQAEINDEQTTKVADRLPELDEEALASAKANVGWAMWFGRAAPGVVHQDTNGVALQVVGRGIVRFISVGDHPHCFETLAMMATSFEEAGVSIEMDPYTIVYPVEMQEVDQEPVSPSLIDAVEVA